MLLQSPAMVLSYVALLLLCEIQASASRRTTRTPSQPVDEQRHLNNAHPQPRVVGGNDADVGEYPFFVHGIDGELCGGSLIHPDIVLTAAHCAGAFSGDAIIGSTDLYAEDSPERIDIDFLLPHPDYTP